MVVKNAGVYRRLVYRRLEIGECFPGTAPTGRVAGVIEIFASAGGKASASEDILAALWTKLVSMGSFDELPVGAVARAPIDVLTSKRSRTTFYGS